VSRSLIATAAALLAAAASLLAPASAEAATTPTATVTASSPVHDEMAVYNRSGSGFTPNSTVTVTVTEPDGKPYPDDHYTHTHATDSAGAFSGWNWIWTAEDPYGTYTFTFDDGHNHTASATIDINHTSVAPVPTTGTHLMLDIGSAPALETVQAWQQESPYTAIGVYIDPGDAVDNRHDKEQANLDAAWVSAVQSGDHPWHVVPIHVGLQAPASCQNDASIFHEMALDAPTALIEGRSAADTAAAQAQALGIDPSVPVMADIESYRSGCAAAVQAYLEGWTAELHRLGWHAGVYGGPSSVAKDLAAARAADPTYVLPDVLWAATDNRHASTQVSWPAGSTASSAGWKVANQYLLGITRSYGNTALTIDESAVDDAVWTLGPVGQMPDTAAPVLTLGAAPQLVRTTSATFTWSAVDAESGLARYELRTRRTARGHAVGVWSGTSALAPASNGRTTQPLKPGEQLCVEVRAVDQAGNASPWSRATCSSRLVDDRAAKAGKGWHRTHQRSAYEKTVTTAVGKHAVLRLGRSAAGRLGVVRSGSGPVVVAVGGRKVGVLHGNGTRWLSLPRAGEVTLTTTTGRKVAIDGFVLIPR